jgi:prepilin-type N-terminal cleavage/methylation domain-containing protein
MEQTMMRTTEHRSYQEGRRDASVHAPTRFASSRSTHRGFTLIEVVVAISILVVVVLALVSNYYAYYANVMNQRYKTIGENFAQLQLEDIQGMSGTMLQRIVGESDPGGIGGDPYPNNPSDPSDPAFLMDNYRDTSSISSVFDSSVVEGDFRIYDLTDVGGLSSANIPGVSVELASNPSWHNVILYHSAFPGYRKRVIITDLTQAVGTPSNLDTVKRIFKIEVTVYWNAPNGAEHQVTVTGLKNDMG